MCTRAHKTHDPDKMSTLAVHKIHVLVHILLSLSSGAVWVPNPTMTLHCTPCSTGALAICMHNYACDQGIGCRYRILPLHSMVPTQDQRKVFLRPPQGVRKIILATNIAETAVTIDDIVCIINSGMQLLLLLLLLLAYLS